MLIQIIDKVILFIFVLSLLNVIRHFYNFLQLFTLSEKNENVRFTLNSIDLLLLGASIAYIITIIITGFKLE